MHVRITIGTVAMTGGAAADQPKLPPKPVPPKAFQARTSIPDSVPSMPEPVDMDAECHRLERVFFAGVDAVSEHDAEDMKRCRWAPPQLKL
jgi:hypothetical protein